MLRGINEGETNVLESFPQILKKDKIFNYLKEIFEKDKKDSDLETESQSKAGDRQFVSSFQTKNVKIRNCCLNKIFAEYLFAIGKNLNVPFYKELVFFIVCYKEAFEKKGLEIYNSLKTDNEILKIEGEFCDDFNGEMIPDMANTVYNLILDKKPEMATILPQQSVFLLQEENRNLINLIKQFCDWAKYFNYTAWDINQDSD